jgi:hypothetical protein
MMHPDTELKFVSPEIGYGVFAKAPIPRGTIVYAPDDLDIKIRVDDDRVQDPLYERFIKRYAILEDGYYIICWDIGKYVNHCCNPNCMSTGYSFEIAIRDIAAGEQLTDEYGIFNIEEEMEFICHHANCRGRLRVNDMELYGLEWDEVVRESLAYLQQVPQPLFSYLDAATSAAVMDYLATGNSYRPVTALRYIKPRSQPTNGTPTSDEKLL